MKPDLILFRVTIKNNNHWIGEGALDTEFYVTTEDFMGALVKADEILTELRGKLQDHKGLDGLRIRGISEVGHMVDGVCYEREIQTESWIEQKARKVREQSG